jgi:hypothetical protein
MSIGASVRAIPRQTASAAHGTRENLTNELAKCWVHHDAGRNGVAWPKWDTFLFVGTFVGIFEIHISRTQCS